MLLAQACVSPEIDKGAFGADVAGVTANDFTGLFPQPFTPLTEILPEVEPGVTVIEVVP